MEVDGVVALCLAPVDVAINKLDARRPKDFEHIAMMVRDGLVTIDSVEDAISQVPYTFLIPAYREALEVVKTTLTLQGQ